MVAAGACAHSVSGSARADPLVAPATTTTPPAPATTTPDDTTSAGPTPQGGEPDTADVGDCLAVQGTNADTAMTVPCDDPTAAYKVDARFDGKTQVDADQNICDPYPQADHVFWAASRLGSPVGVVLCLEPTH